MQVFHAMPHEDYKMSSTWDQRINMCRPCEDIAVDLSCEQDVSKGYRAESFCLSQYVHAVPCPFGSENLCVVLIVLRGPCCSDLPEGFTGICRPGLLQGNGVSLAQRLQEWMHQSGGYVSLRQQESSDFCQHCQVCPSPGNQQETDSSAMLQPRHLSPMGQYSAFSTVIWSSGREQRNLCHMH